MLDENWLRARRVLVHCLEARHCWHSRAAHAAFWKDEKAVAERLRDTVLLEALGADDFPIKISEIRVAEDPLNSTARGAL